MYPLEQVQAGGAQGGGFEVGGRAVLVVRIVVGAQQPAANSAALAVGADGEDGQVVVGDPGGVVLVEGCIEDAEPLGPRPVAVVSCCALGWPTEPSGYRGQREGHDRPGTRARLAFAADSSDLPVSVTAAATSPEKPGFPGRAGGGDGGRVGHPVAEGGYLPADGSADGDPERAGEDRAGKAAEPARRGTGTSGLSARSVSARSAIAESHR